MAGNQRRKSKGFTKPIGRSKEVTPFRLLYPGRAERARELFLLSSTICFTYGGWIGIAGTAEQEEIDVMYETAARLFPKFAMSVMQDDGPALTDKSAPLLLTTTRWICSLDLPACEQELWNGPALASRRRNGAR